MVPKISKGFDVVDTPEPIKPEFDIVSPGAELKYVETRLKAVAQSTADVHKELAAIAAAPTYGREIKLTDAEGEPVMIPGADGKDYPAITYEGVTSKTLRNLLANAGIGLMTVIPDEENLRIRLGGELNRLVTQAREYNDRKSRTLNLIEVTARRERGEE